jgi:four helix bundle protein
MDIKNKTSSRSTERVSKRKKPRSRKMNYENKRVNGELDYEVYHFVFQTAIEIFEEIFEASRRFPKNKFYLTDQVRRHSESVCVNLAEAWRMQEQRSALISKLSDAAEAASKAQNCLEFATKYNYIEKDVFKKIDSRYEEIFEDIFTMLCNGEGSRYLPEEKMQFCYSGKSA